MSNLKTNQNSKSNTYFKLNLVLLAITVIANIIAYKYLPDQVGIHSTGGEFDKYIGKMMFLFLTPLVSIIINVYSSVIVSKVALKGFIVGIILTGVNIFIILSNLNLV